MLQASFVTSAPKIEDCPKENWPEYALIGRSNVGKSSLLNYLCNRTSLARVSNTPGKTRTFNYYNIDDSWFLVDLPGYGYAKVSKERRSTWDRNLVEYLLEREALRYLAVLIDGSLEPQKIDLEFMSWLTISEVPFIIIKTKIDKVKQNELARVRTLMQQEITNRALNPQAIFEVSNLKKVGRQQILDFIDLDLQSSADSSESIASV